MEGLRKQVDKFFFWHPGVKDLLEFGLISIPILAVGFMWYVAGKVDSEWAGAALVCSPAALFVSAALAIAR